MKDRWKILITSLIVTAVIALLIGLLSASFKLVALREYGILHYTVYNTVEDQDARSNGNYLVGLDHSFYSFPRGILMIEFDTLTLTKDKSMVEIEGAFAGRLIKGEVMSLFRNHGFEYESFLKASVEEYTRQAIESYSLSDLIRNRTEVDRNVNRYVCLKLEVDYSWIQCDLVSLGRIGANIPQPELIDPEITFEKKKIALLQQQIQTQKTANVYISGGFEMLQQLEQVHISLFNNISAAISSIPANTQRPQLARYIIDSARHPVLRTEFKIVL